ncbi:hypothetical protein HDU97_003464 [Phlyctochytrium planicorne]|nr:hypothetical protein HDU97_003464 [Phlyctochytrium planicorne]
MQGQLTSGVKSKYSGMLQAMNVVLKEEGYRGLFSGILAATAGSLASTLMYFACYEGIKREMLDRHINPTISYLTAASIGDVVASVLYVPSEVVKTRLQLQGRLTGAASVSNRDYRGSVHAFKSIYKKRGIKGLYYGWGATLLRDVPYTALQFSIYENFKSFLLNRFCDSDESKLTSAHDMVSGGVAGVIAGALTTPLDVCKTYLMTQKRSPLPRAQFLSLEKGPTSTTAGVGNPVAIRPAPYYTGVFSAFKGIYAQNGLPGLFAGVGPRMVWTGLQSMIMFLVYENLLSAVNTMRKSEDVSHTKR